MKIEHNSQSKLYRTPFGAVTNNSEVTLRIALSELGIPTHIRLCCDFFGEKKSFNMAYVFEASGLFFYEASIHIPDKTGLIFYYFDIEASGIKYFYGNNTENLGGIGKIYDKIPEKQFQITVYDKDYKTPDWWKNCVCYQIFPDRFSNGNENGEFQGNRNDIIKRSWGDIPYFKAEQFGGKYLANDFFGGNLLGIEKKLPYLAELGISCIYLNPIFKAYSNHRYDTGDYKTIDPMLGTEEDFKRLCKTAERFGIKIILDGVFNHTGSDSLYFNKNGNYDSIGAYQSKESPYFDWYRFSSYPDKYESWWGIDTLPQVEENSEGFQEFILKDKDAVIKKWLDLGGSGWRLDVVDELPDFFVKILRSEVKNKKPDAVIIGEVWEDASNKVAYGQSRQYFMGEELDGVMNYPLRNALIDFIMGNISADTFDRRIMSLKENYPGEAFYSCFNFLSSHDTERILTVLGGRACKNKDGQAQEILSEQEWTLAIKRLKCLIAMQVFLPGVPVIFYGDEAGLEGYSDPFCRKCFPWGHENTDLTEFYKQSISLRKESGAFTSGEFETVYKFEGGYGFIRIGDKESYVVLINSGTFQTFRVDVARFGIFKLLLTGGCEEHISDDGIFYVDMPELSVKVFKNENFKK